MYRRNNVYMLLVEDATKNKKAQRVKRAAEHTQIGSYSPLPKLNLRITKH